MDMTHIIPNPKNYDEYVRQRNARTIQAMLQYSRMTGSFIKDNNLSIRMLFDNGYTFDVVSDSMVKE